jgi:hypothetical protein
VRYRNALRREIGISVKDQEKSVLRIRDVCPGSDFFHPGFRVDKIPDPDPNQRI